MKFNRLEIDDINPKIKYISVKKYFDENTWNRINSQLVLFGRYNCTSQNPKCDNCKLKNICKRK